MSRSTFATAAVVDGKNIDVANLETIHLVPLAAQDPTETKKLLEAAKYPGFFYLDLQGDAPPPQVVTDIPKVYNSSKKYFGQHHDLKMKDYREDQEPGYKKSDCDETFEVLYDEITKGCPITSKHILGEDATLLQEFSQSCHSACHTMLHALSIGLPNLSLPSHHQPDSPSDTSLKLISEPALPKLADVVENKHTDRGTFTLLFHDCWGLHIELPNEGKWAFTRPPAQGCVLVNVGDSLEKLSGCTLRSPVHRVTQIGDGAEERHFISYFLRPENALKEAWAKG